MLWGFQKKCRTRVHCIVWGLFADYNCKSRLCYSWRVASFLLDITIYNTKSCWLNAALTCRFQYVSLKGLYDFKASATPTMDPMAAAIETTRQTTLNICIATHLEDQRRILFCAMYIVTGKYTVNGQNAKAPRSPTTLLKNGSIKKIINLTSKEK